MLAAGAQVAANIVAADWGLRQVVVNTTPAPPTPSYAWKFYLVDKFPPAAPQRAYGYHTVEGDTVVAYINVPLCSSIFGTITDFPQVGTPKDSFYTPQKQILFPGSVSEVLTHELAEALVDPQVNRYADDGTDAPGNMWMIEVGDHADSWRYVVTGSVTTTTGTIIKRRTTRTQRMIAQDHTTPAFYDSYNTTGPYSHTGNAPGPFKIDVKNTTCYAWRRSATGAPITQGYDRLGGETPNQTATPSATPPSPKNT